MVDLGSGAGIDCFIAAKRVGAEGRVYGIDMTDQMLSVARECQPQVAEALGYDAVEFRQGFLEEIPVDDATVDIGPTIVDHNTHTPSTVDAGHTHYSAQWQCFVRSRSLPRAECLT